MRVLLLNQAFHPDRVSSGQHLTDLALALARDGHQVTVMTSARGYDDPSITFPPRERWRGIDIVRIRPIPAGKATRWRRVVEFGSYLIKCAFRLALQPRADLVVAMTSPPLISVLGACFARLKGSRFVFWVMDLNPDEAIAAGWLKPDSFAARVLGGLLKFSLAQADAVVALDRYMASVVEAKGVPRERIVVLPPWSHDGVAYDDSGRGEFRRRHGWDDRFVVMYAGNHSPCNPLATVLAAAERLRDRRDILFCFMGGGSEFRNIERYVSDERPGNIACLPYQPLAALGGALSAADLHVVTFGDAFRGLIHPCKIYNVLKVGAPVLYVGPEPSHITDILQSPSGPIRSWSLRHGDVDGVVHAILEARAASSRRVSTAAIETPFDLDVLLPQLVDLVTSSDVRAIDPILERS